MVGVPRRMQALSGGWDSQKHRDFGLEAGVEQAADSGEVMLAGDREGETKAEA